MRKLELWERYSRGEVHAIFSPETAFVSQAGTWGLQGMVRVPSRRGDWVFFVTYGKGQGDHVFDESITTDGVLSWQSQPAQGLLDSAIQELIAHDERVNSIHLFLRTRNRAPYTYLGLLGYLTHDLVRERPVHFQWQLLNWPMPEEVRERDELELIIPDKQPVPGSSDHRNGALTIVPLPPGKVVRTGVSTEQFRHNKSPDYASRDARNRTLGLAGEKLVLEHERAQLMANGRADLASLLVHVSVIEGDSAGYDIRSFAVDGSVRYIEVKTTQGGPGTSFFVSANEVAFSQKNSPAYSLIRLFEYSPDLNQTKAYILMGDLARHLSLKPIVFRADIAPPESQ